MSLKNRRWLPCIDSRFEAYLAYDTTAPVFETHKQQEVPDMFTGTTLIKKRQPHLELLPYTLEALQKRMARGADVPYWMEEQLEQFRQRFADGRLGDCAIAGKPAPESRGGQWRQRDVAV